MNATSSDTSNFQKALNVWEEIDLPNLQKQLDEDAVSIRTKQKSLLASRKDLALKTKQFKKLEDTEKLKEINVIFKQYQNEIDNLNKNNKFVELVFFKLYKDLSEAPDPKPLLSSSMKAFKNLKEVETLQSEIFTLKENLSKVSDYDSIKSKLMNSEQKYAERLKQKLSSKDDEYKSKVQDLNLSISKKDTEIYILNKRLEELETLNKISLNKNKDENINHDGSNNSNDLSVELDLVTRDLQISKSKIYELEKKNNELREKLNSKNASNDEIYNLDQQVKSLEKINSELIEKSNSESQKIQEYPILVEKLSKVTTANDNNLSKIKSLELKLADITSPKNMANINDQNLITRNNQLTNDLVGFRNKNDDLSRKNNMLSANLKQLNLELSQLKAVNERLEADISYVKSNNNNNNNNDNWDSMSMMSGVSRLPSNLPSRSISAGKLHNSGRISPAASIAGFDDTSSVFGGAASNSSNPTDGSLLLIITQQRDRFRLKISELEVKLRENAKLTNELKKNNSDLTKTITKLTTEIKYLQQSGRKSNSLITAATPYSDQLESGTYDTLFRDDYESYSYINENPLLNPLGKYLGIDRDAAKKIDKKLNAFEKFFYNFFKIVLANEHSRIIFIIYLCVIHLILILSILRFFLGSSSSDDIAAMSLPN